jgi:hypothetical protein
MLILFNLTKSVTYRFFRLLTLGIIFIIPFTLLPIIPSHFLIISDAGQPPITSTPQMEEIQVMVFHHQPPGKPSAKSMLQDFSRGIRF